MDGWTDANLNPYVTPCFKKPHPVTSKCDKNNKIVKIKYIHFLTVHFLTNLTVLHAVASRLMLCHCHRFS